MFRVNGGVQEGMLATQALTVCAAACVTQNETVGIHNVQITTLAHPVLHLCSLTQSLGTGETAGFHLNTCGSSSLGVFSGYDTCFASSDNIAVSNVLHDNSIAMHHAVVQLV